MGRVFAEQPGDGRIQIGAAGSADRRPRRLHPMQPGVDLDGTGELHQPRRQRDLAAAQAQWYAFAVPLLVGLPEGRHRDVVEPDLFGEPGAQPGVGGQEVHDLPHLGSGQRDDPPGSIHTGAVRAGAAHTAKATI